MDLLYDLATHMNDFMLQRPSLLLVVVLGFVVSPPLVLLHELGHAFAARALLGADVEVVVAGKGRLLHARMGWLTVRLHAFGATDRGTGGYAHWTSHRVLTVRRLVLVQLAGPAASACGWAATALLLARVGPGALHALLWSATVVGAFATLVTAIPLTLADRRGSTHYSDAAAALRIVRLARAGASAR